ncbi:hypothetical protein LTR65_003501 [Meristemomyces frigidus]
MDDGISTTPLFKLSPELRNMIWIFVLVETEPIPFSSLHNTKHHVVEPGITRTCSTVRKEALAIFDTNNALERRIDGRKRPAEVLNSDPDYPAGNTALRPSSRGTPFLFSAAELVGRRSISEEPVIPPIPSQPQNRLFRQLIDTTGIKKEFWKDFDVRFAGSMNKSQISWGE